MAGTYDFEEQERIAELKAWWEDNRWYVLGAIVAAVVVFGGWQGWRWWNVHQGESAAMLFRPVAEAAQQGGDKPDAAALAKAAQPLVDKHPDAYLASEAQLLVAKAAFEAGDLALARERLAWVVDHGPELLRPTARLRLAAVLLQQKKYDDALRTLDAVKEDSFAPLAADLRGDVMLAQGRRDEARAAYKVAVERAAPGNPVRNIAETKLAALGGAQ